MHTLHSAVAFIRNIKPKLTSLNLHCALTGSVLYKGFSLKNLDIVIYPHDDSDNGTLVPTTEAVFTKLKSLFPTLKCVEPDDRPASRRIGKLVLDNCNYNFIILVDEAPSNNRYS